MERRSFLLLLAASGAHGIAVTPAPPIPPGPTACGIRYTSISDTWRSTRNTCCADQYGRCLGPTSHFSGGWLIPTPNKTEGYKTMGDFPSSTNCGSLTPWNPKYYNFQDTGVGGDRWYRFEGAGGNALALTPLPTGNIDCDTGPNPWPPHDRLYCGTSNSGWLSGFKWPANPDCTTDDDCGPNGAGGPTSACVGGCTSNHGCANPTGRCAPFNPKPGRYPTADEGVVNMTTCFGGDSEQTCGDYVAVGVISCEGFLLWRLPYAADCESGYCTVTASVV